MSISGKKFARFASVYARARVILIANPGERAYVGSTSHSLASALRRGLLPRPFLTVMMNFFRGVPLFSTLAKPGVCIINEKFNLCMLCPLG